MDDIRVQVEGATELAKAMRKAGDDLPKALREVHKRLADIVVKHALPNVPVGPSGGLLKTVKGLATQTKATGKAGSNKVPYAPAIHWGTGPRLGLKGPHNIARKPFLWNALQQTRSQVEEEYGEEMEALMDRALAQVRNR